jgi:DNA-binding LytR/AlgR family response regulator
VRARGVVAEDERVLREQLVELLREAWPDLELVAVARDGLEAIRALDSLRPEVMFLDIQMPEATGLDVARRASGRCHVVFVTAYDQFAVSAFEQGAVDYVMKPLSAERIATAVRRVQERLRSTPANLNALVDELRGAPRANGNHLRWIRASCGQDIQLITTDEILYFQSDTKYTRVVARTREGLIRKTLKELVEALDPSSFWQVHRATVVNLNAIERVARDLHGHLVLRLRDRKETLSVSESFAHLFRQM